jgi:hypothetical protein
MGDVMHLPNYQHTPPAPDPTKKRWLIKCFVCGASDHTIARFDNRSLLLLLKLRGYGHADDWMVDFNAYADIQVLQCYCPKCTSKQSKKGIMVRGFGTISEEQLESDRAKQHNQEIVVRRIFEATRLVHFDFSPAEVLAICRTAWRQVNEEAAL